MISKNELLHLINEYDQNKGIFKQLIGTNDDLMDIVKEFVALPEIVSMANNSEFTFDFFTQKISAESKKLLNLLVYNYENLTEPDSLPLSFKLLSQWKSGQYYRKNTNSKKLMSIPLSFWIQMFNYLGELDLSSLAKSCNFFSQITPYGPSTISKSALTQLVTEYDSDKGFLKRLTHTNDDLMNIVKKFLQLPEIEGLTESIKFNFKFFLSRLSENDRKKVSLLLDNYKNLPQQERLLSFKLLSLWQSGKYYNRLTNEKNLIILPAEIWEKIFSYLNKREICRLAKTCNFFNQHPNLKKIREATPINSFQLFNFEKPNRTTNYELDSYGKIIKLSHNSLALVTFREIQIFHIKNFSESISFIPVSTLKGKDDERIFLATKVSSNLLATATEMDYNKIFNIYIWDLQNKKCLKKIPVNKPNTLEVINDQFVSVHDNNLVCFWNLEDYTHVTMRLNYSLGDLGGFRRSEKLKESGIEEMARGGIQEKGLLGSWKDHFVTIDETYLYCENNSRDVGNFINTWDTNGKHLRRLHDGMTSFDGWCLIGDLLLTTNNNKISIWDLEKGCLENEIAASTFIPRGEIVVLNAAAGLIATGGAVNEKSCISKLLIWNYFSGECIAAHDLPEETSRASFELLNFSNGYLVARTNKRLCGWQFSELAPSVQEEKKAILSP